MQKGGMVLVFRKVVPVTIYVLTIADFMEGGSREAIGRLKPIVIPT